MLTDPRESAPLTAALWPGPTSTCNLLLQVTSKPPAPPPAGAADPSNQYGVAFRTYAPEALLHGPRPSVEENYRLNHTHQVRRLRGDLGTKSHLAARRTWSVGRAWLAAALLPAGAGPAPASHARTRGSRHTACPGIHTANRTPSSLQAPLPGSRSHRPAGLA